MVYEIKKDNVTSLTNYKSSLDNSKYTCEPVFGGINSNGEPVYGCVNVSGLLAKLEELNSSKKK